MAGDHHNRRRIRPVKQQSKRKALLAARKAGEAARRQAQALEDPAGYRAALVEGARERESATLGEVFHQLGVQAQREPE